MFDYKSRYKELPHSFLRDHRGREVAVVPIPPVPVQSIKGYHIMKQGHRLDHLAAKYLDNAAGFWRISEVNEVMLPEALSEQAEIAIPNKNG